MAEAVEPAATPSPRARGRARRLPWRRWLRAAHRDIGYLCVGLTLTYAISGLAVNHVADWDPSFSSFEATASLPAPVTGSDADIASAALTALGVDATPRDIYRAGPRQLDVIFDSHTVHVNPATGVVVDEGQSPRPLLREANWLHLNRGKAAWTLFADSYAVLLIVLALSGMFMIRGRKGLVGRGAVLVLIGFAVPIGYLMASGGP